MSFQPWLALVNRKVKKPENIDCDNAVDLLKNMARALSGAFSASCIEVKKRKFSSAAKVETDKRGQANLQSTNAIDWEERGTALKDNLGFRAARHQPSNAAEAVLQGLSRDPKGKGKVVDEERHFELLLGVGLALAILVALGSSCFIVGLKVKPRAPSYWSNRTWSPFHNDFEAEVDVTMELRDTVQQLFDMTTKKETPTMKHHPP
ncbi:unnamed protein product [Effrenium voratum]|nr:unnamed protein product [Effrenium voratum]